MATSSVSVMSSGSSSRVAWDLRSTTDGTAFGLTTFALFTLALGLDFLTAAFLVDARLARTFVFFLLAFGLALLDADDFDFLFVAFLRFFAIPLPSSSVVSGTFLWRTPGDSI